MLYLAVCTYNRSAVCLHATRIAALWEFWTDWLPTETLFLPHNVLGTQAIVTAAVTHMATRRCLATRPGLRRRAPLPHLGLGGVGEVEAEAEAVLVGAEKGEVGGEGEGEGVRGGEMARRRRLPRCRTKTTTAKRLRMTVRPHVRGHGSRGGGACGTARRICTRVRPPS